jgi:hypothetical protein
MALTPRPQKNYRQPNYPTSLSVRSKPRLLTSNLPFRWSFDHRLKTIAVTLLTIGVASGASGKASHHNVTRPKPVPAYNGHPLVAPIFEHGYGGVAMGCVVVAHRYAIVSEEEARQVIEDEMAKYGVRPTVHDQDLSGVEVPLTYRRFVVDGKEITEEAFLHDGGHRLLLNPEEPFIAHMKEYSRPSEFNLDEIDVGRSIGWEFVSFEDYENNKFLLPQEHTSSVWSISPKDLAEALRGKIAESNAEMSIGLFYPPVIEEECWSGGELWGTCRCCDRKEIIDSRLEQMKEESKTQLRLQVRDFIGWLKAQGAI